MNLRCLVKLFLADCSKLLGSCSSIYKTKATFTIPTIRAALAHIYWKFKCIS